MTTVLYEPAEYHMRVSGHAKSAENIDPVCAGASALAWALVEAASNGNYKAALYIDQKTAIIDVRCRPDEEEERNCRYMFEIILGGLSLIADAHPGNMEIRIGG